MTSKEKYCDPKLCEGLKAFHVPIKLATNENLKGMGYVVDDPDDFTVEKGTFKIKVWPTQGWRPMDPGCGDEAGTTEGKFDIYWDGDLLYGKNHSIATKANHYLLGYGKPPAECKACKRGTPSEESPSSVRLWYSDYHPDGGQLFYPEDGQPFITNLAPPIGDDIKPTDFTAFYVPAGKGCYIHPGVWHNAVYTHPSSGTDRTFFNRQGRVHARISVNWAEEFGVLMHVPLGLEEKGDAEHGAKKARTTAKASA
mmetsp:Transcript_8359/g.14047  ORF Transcript_8359/g.14047 Transcript_8359/m.14047 type:complete len:254 (+) Transcript_8359:112-873(+)